MLSVHTDLDELWATHGSSDHNLPDVVQLLARLHEDSASPCSAAARPHHLCYSIAHSTPVAHDAHAAQGLIFAALQKHIVWASRQLLWLESRDVREALPSHDLHHGPTTFDADLPLETGAECSRLAVANNMLVTLSLSVDMQQADLVEGVILAVCCPCGACLCMCFALLDALSSPCSLCMTCAQSPLNTSALG